jgi:hypothetical protein
VSSCCDNNVLLVVAHTPVWHVPAMAMLACLKPVLSCPVPCCAVFVLFSSAVVHFTAVACSNSVSWEKCGARFRSWYGLNLPQAHGTELMTLSQDMCMYIGTAHGILAPSATGTAEPLRKLYTKARDGTWHLAPRHTPGPSHACALLKRHCLIHWLSNARGARQSVWLASWNAAGCRQAYARCKAGVGVGKSHSLA